MPRIIGANVSDLLSSCLSVSYVIHQDMRGHAGSVIPMGRGIVQSIAKKKLSTKSSTESEFVRGSKHIP